MVALVDRVSALADAFSGKLSQLNTMLTGAKRQRYVNVLDFRQPVDPDFTNAFRAALATGKSVFVPETCLISDSITIAAPGQQIFGNSVGSGAIAVNGGFNLSAQGIVIITPAASESGAGLSDISILCGQPDTASRAAMIQYPWAVQAPGCTRMHFGGQVRIAGAWNGLNLSGNCGGFVGDNIEIGAINQDFALEGLDTFVLNSLKLWPWGFTLPNQYAVYSDGVGGGTINRVDGLAIGCLATFRRRLVCNGGVGFGTIGQLHLDGRYGRWEQAGGRITVGPSYATTEGVGDFLIQVSDGSLGMGDTWLLGSGIASPSTTALVQISGAADFAMSSLSVDQPGPAQRLVQQTGALSKAQIGGGTVRGIQGQARTVPVIDVQDGRASIGNIVFDDKGSGSGTAIRIANDNWHYVEAHSLTGWAVSLPVARTYGTYHTNAATAGAALKTDGTETNAVMATRVNELLAAVRGYGIVA